MGVIHKITSPVSQVYESSNSFTAPLVKGGAMNLKEGGGVNALEGGGQYIKNNNIWKRWEVHDPPPPAPMVAPSLPLFPPIL